MPDDDAGALVALEELAGAAELCADDVPVDVVDEPDVAGAGVADEELDVVDDDGAPCVDGVAAGSDAGVVE